jgi:succinyl-diaminopimelate desuccinylase
MKGSVAAFVVALEQFVATHPDHRGTVGLLLTSDEEGDAIDGVRKVADVFRERGQRIDWCITGEPSSKERPRRPASRRPSWHAVGDADGQGRAGPCRLPDKARNPIHLAMPAWQNSRRGNGTTATTRSRRPACRSATCTLAPAPTT